MPKPSPRHLFVPLLCVSACTFPRFEATKVVEFSVSAHDLEAIRCGSHNGGVVATGQDGDVVQVRVELAVRGESEAEAAANLELLAIGQDRQGGRLHLYGSYPQDRLRNRSPSFAFTLWVPPRLALQLESHNGDLEVRGVHGAIDLTTHNGAVTVEIGGPRVQATTHNGAVTAELTGTGGLDGSLLSHNGDVIVVANGDRDAAVTASTHNGRVSVQGPFVAGQQGRRSAQVRLGSGHGQLSATSHNGDVVLR